MSYSTELQKNNQELRGILDAVNALPEADSGGADSPDATPEYSEGLSYFFKDTNSYLILGYGDWDGEDLIIPPTYDDGTNGEHPVDELGYSIFGNNTKIKSATFPETIDLIGGPIFENCPNLTHLYIPYIKYVASFCIWGLTGLEYVKFKDISSIEGGNFTGGNKSTVYDFTECASIPTLECYEVSEQFGENPIIKVPANLLDEWKNATNWTLYADYIVVEGQENVQEKTIDITENGSYEIVPDEGKLLRKVTANVNVGGGGDSNTLDALIDGSITEISSDATTIRVGAFDRCDKLTSATFPNATDIGQSAFERCQALKSIYSPKVTNIGQAAFDYCRALTSVEFPNVTTIGNNAFATCSKLASIYFPNATTIGQNAFYYCEALTSVDLPNAKSLNGSCFSKCEILTSVKLPKVTSILGYTFENCKKCLEYDFSGCVAVPTLSNTNAFNKINSNAKIKVPAALYDEWIAATNWSTYASYIVAV